MYCYFSDEFECCLAGYPGHPPNKQHKQVGGDWMQWTTDVIEPVRLPKGRHIYYMNATSAGMSGSPIYCYNKKQGGNSHAYAIGVHVGGAQANWAVPICYHMQTSCQRRKGPGTNFNY